MSKALKYPGAFSWALYDWANSGWATTVLAAFFPIFFADYWSAGVDATVSTFWLGVSVSAAGLTVALLAPILGALADRGAYKKRMLLGFAAFSMVATAALFLVEQGHWPLAAGLYVLAHIGFLSSNIFYDALLVSVSDESSVDSLSGFGFALGYLGGGLLFAVNVVMTQRPEWFGLADAAAAVRWSFLSVSVWWAVFTIPLLWRVPETGGDGGLTLAHAAREGFTQLFRTFREVRKHRTVFLFLVAYWFYIDGVNTIIVMAVKFGRAVGIPAEDLIIALLMLQFVAFPCAWLFGRLGQRFGARRFIVFAVLVYLIITPLAAQLDTRPWIIFGVSFNKFFTLAFLIGTVQGGVQALSRSLYTRLIPRRQSAEFFGFYGMVGKFAAIIVRDGFTDVRGQAFKHVHDDAGGLGGGFATQVWRR